MHDVGKYSTIRIFLSEEGNIKVLVWSTRRIKKRKVYIFDILNEKEI